MSGTSIFNMGRLAGLFAVGAMLLSGCAAPTVAARVTSFQQWPAGVEGSRTSSCRPTPRKPIISNTSRSRTWSEPVSAPPACVEAQAGAKPRFDVSFTYGTSQTQVMVRRPYDPGFYGGYGYGHGGYYGPRPWGGGFGYWGPDWVDVPMVVQRNALSLQIRTSSGAAPRSIVQPPMC